jgi:hypothetical protein
MRRTDLALVGLVILWSGIAFVGITPRKATAELGVIPVGIYTSNQPPPQGIRRPRLTRTGFNPFRLKKLVRDRDYYLYLEVKEKVRDSPLPNYVHAIVYRFPPPRANNHDEPKFVEDYSFPVTENDVISTDSAGLRTFRTRGQVLELRRRLLSRKGIIAVTATGFEDDFDHPVQNSKTFRIANVDREQDEAGECETGNPADCSGN